MFTASKTICSGAECDEVPIEFDISVSWPDSADTEENSVGIRMVGRASDPESLLAAINEVAPAFEALHADALGLDLPAL